MTKLEERITSGLQEAAERIPDRSPEPRPAVVTGRTRRWVAVAAVAAALLLFAPLVFLGGSDNPDTGSGDELPGPADTTTTIILGSGTSSPPDAQFDSAQFIRLRFFQELNLECAGLEVVDNGGFDEYEAEIWIDNDAGYARLSLTYPDGSTYDLMLKGEPGDWDQAWGMGSDLGRSAGCRQNMGGGGLTETVAGWGFQDSSILWLAAYLRPVSPGTGGVWIDHEGRVTLARPLEDGIYLIGANSEYGADTRFEFGLDESETRVLVETRTIIIPGEFEVAASVEVLESGPATMPADVFDTAGFAPLWGGDPVPTTLAP